jgi:hypothetical protein
MVYGNLPANGDHRHQADDIGHDFRYEGCVVGRKALPGRGREPETAAEGEIARNLSGKAYRDREKRLWKVGGDPAPKV